MAEKRILQALIKEIAGAAALGEKNKNSKKLRVGLVGEGYLLEPMARAYKSIRNCESVSYYNPVKTKATKIGRAIGADSVFSDFGQLKKSVDIAEVFEISGGRRKKVEELLLAGIPTSLQKPIATNLDEADELIRAARKSGTLLRVNEYPLYYKPYLKAAELIKKMEIGEVCAIRLRSNLVGEGGWGPLEDLLKKESPFFHPAFDKFALAASLVGDIDSVSVYANAVSPGKPGQALVAFKCRAEGCFGVMDMTYAPESAIRTEGLPCDDQVEIAGTDGIIWVNHFHGKMTEEPWLEVRRGKKHYTIGIGSGMELDWESCLKFSAEDFIKSSCAGKTPRHSIHESRKALKALLAAREAAETGATISV